MKFFDWLGSIRQKLAKKDMHSMFKALIDNIKVGIYASLAKLSNLKETNEKLALYHYDHQNLTDAIFRFRMLQKFAPKVSNEFFLGRLYLEKRDLPNAMIHLSNYLASKDKEWTNEAEYCLKIAKGKQAEITSIPTYIILHSYTQFANIYIAALAKGNAQPTTSILFQTFHLLIAARFSKKYIKICDIGCSDGTVGFLCRKNYSIDKLLGVEIVDILVDYAQKRKNDAIPTYDEVIDDDFNNCYDKIGKDYDLIIADDWITLYPDIDHFGKMMDKIISASGVIVFTFTENPQVTNFALSPATEQFEFNSDYVRQKLIENKMNILAESDVEYDVVIKSKLFILEKLKAKVAKKEN